jgi:hypothetical protein
MYEYRRSKACIWGHRLNKIPPARQRTQFREFLKRAVAEYSWQGCTLRILPATLRDEIQHFERLLGLSADSFSLLTPQQCEICLDEIVNNPALHASVAQWFLVSKWLIDAQPVPTRTRIGWHCGQSSVMSTFFQFESIEHFRYVKQVLADLGLCTLNDKNLKLSKL